jgi:hypothetical protein
MPESTTAVDSAIDPASITFDHATIASLLALRRAGTGTDELIDVDQCGEKPDIH